VVLDLSMPIEAMQGGGPIRRALLCLNYATGDELSHGSYCRRSNLDRRDQCQAAWRLDETVTNRPPWRPRRTAV
jgi:hypothetical protein